MAVYRTKKHFTLTTEGLIPHFKYSQDLELPVKVELHSKSTPADIGSIPRPMRDNNGHLVYAWPGGGMYIPEVITDGENNA